MPDYADAQKARPIFVVGTPRSGTTLTASIIGNHPDVFMPGECHFFELIASENPNKPMEETAKQAAIDQLLTIYGVYNQPEDQADVEEMFPDFSSLAPLLAACTEADLLHAFMKPRAEQKSASRWGNQAPKDIFHYDKIRKAYPNAHFVICIRDSRDFLHSYKNRWRVSDHGVRLRKLYHPILTSLLWRSTMQVVQKLAQELPEDAYTIIRYEDLVTQSHATVQTLCERLQLSYSDDLTTGATHNSSSNDKPSGIFSSSIGLWKTELSDAEIAICQRLNQSIMTELGYEISDEHQQDPLGQVRLCLSLPGRAIAALRSNSAQRGPLLQYILRRLQHK